MLSDSKIIALYCIVDDILKSLNHKEDIRVRVSDLFEAEFIHAKAQRKSNSKRKDEPHVSFLKQHMRKQIETDFSMIKAKMLRKIHAVTKDGFLIKVALFVIAYTFDKLI